MSRKLMVNDGRAERELLLVGKMVVGRDPACDISDADPLLSRRHAEFVAGARDVVVRDLDSRNGILVNGIKVGECLLRPGDIVQIGHLQLRYVEDGAPLSVEAEADEDSDETAVITRPPPPPLPRGARPPGSIGSAATAAPAEDKTRLVVPSPSPAQASPPPAPAPAHRPEAAMEVPPSEDDERTRLVAPPTFRAPLEQPAPTPSPSVPPSVAPPVAQPIAAPAPATPAAVRSRPAARPAAAEPGHPARATASSWTLFVLVRIAMLSALVFLATAIPLSLWQGRSIPPETASSAIVLVLPAILAIVATYFTARSIQNRTMRALKLLVENLELAVGGKLDTIGDPLGAKPVKELSDALSYLIARLRASTGGELAATDLGRSRSTAPPAARAERRATLAPVDSRSARPPVEARIVANAQFRVIEASVACTELLGAPPEALIGEHLLEAIPDRQVGDAVMRCLSALAPQDEQRTSIAAANRPYTLSILMTRAGKEQPINITFRAEQPAGET